MYACGEGGVYSAVWELAENAGLGARIQLKKVPLKQETVEICDYFNISPYQLLSVGAVLLTATMARKYWRSWLPRASRQLSSDI